MRRARYAQARLKAALPETPAARARRLAKQQFGWTDYGGWSQLELQPGVFHFCCRSVVELSGFVALCPLLKMSFSEDVLRKAGLVKDLDGVEAWVGDGWSWLWALYRAWPELYARTPKEHLERRRVWREEVALEKLRDDEQGAVFLELLERYEEDEGARQSALGTPCGPRSRPSLFAEEAR